MNFAHVESKLLQETTTSINYKREKFDGNNGGRVADTFGGNVLGLRSRAVPTWR